MQRVKEYTASLIATHWIHVAAIIVLAVTGIWIAVGGPMATLRFIHFIFAYFITIDIFIRIYIAFFSREKADWRDLAPNKADLKLVVPTLKHYIYIQKYRHVTDGYNPIQKIAYLFSFVLVFAQIFTGFALYDGRFFWIVNSRSIFGWVGVIFGGLPGLRLWHYIFTIVLILFTAIHIYMAIWTDLYEKNGVLASIFTGYKLRKD